MTGALSIGFLPQEGCVLNLSIDKDDEPRDWHDLFEDIEDRIDDFFGGD